MRGTLYIRNEPVFPPPAPYQPEGTPLFTFELVATLYFGVLAAVSPFTGAFSRSAGVGAAAAIFAGAIVALSRVLGADARLWLGHLYLIAGYWLPALLVTRSPHRFEAWLRRTESFGSFRSFGSFGSFGSFWELAYLCCYPVVPAAFLAVYLNGSTVDVDRFWTSVLAAGYVCYISLPWLVSRPPRTLEGVLANTSRARRLNLRVLDRFSHGWNTFPSGHVAVAFAAALSVMPSAPRAGLAFLSLAVGILIGSVTGRYHYTVDALTGATVGVTIPLMLTRLTSIAAIGGLLSVAVHAQTAGDAMRGQEIYKQRCAVCHADALQGLVGPPLAGEAFAKLWGNASELQEKIQKTMPQDDPGSLTAAQASDLAAFIVRTGAATAAASAPAAPVASHDTPTYPPTANLAQLMRGIFFPSSNLIFEVQGHDPGEKKDGKPYEPSANDNFSWAQWGAGIYSPWEIVDYAALSIADAAPLMLVPGRRCENGRAVPSDRDDWKKFTQELLDAGKAAYKASQSRSQEAVSEVSNQLADACLQCHQRYRDKPGGTTDDPSNKAARCQ
jgi:mono/diheme cytochrome c family protein